MATRPAGHLGSAPMATHDVTMNLSHPITVMNVDVEFEVRADGELMGKVQISRGGIDWMPFKSHPRAATWEQFAAWMEGTALEGGSTDVLLLAPQKVRRDRF